MLQRRRGGVFPVAPVLPGLLDAAVLEDAAQVHGRLRAEVAVAVVELGPPERPRVEELGLEHGVGSVETMPSSPTCSRQDTMDGATSRGIAGEGRGAGSCAVGPR